MARTFEEIVRDIMGQQATTIASLMQQLDASNERIAELTAPKPDQPPSPPSE